jgi:uncharacterized protein
MLGYARRLARVTVVLHGGEPLLAGSARVAAIAQAVRAAMPTGTTVKIGMQTNGVLLTEPMLDRLLEHRIHVGVSLDGTAENNDSRRRTINGKGSFAKVERGLRLLNSQRYRPIYSGLLCTIDPDTDPVATYEALLRFAPPVIDVLMPHASFTASSVPVDTRVGDWLVAVFDRWARERTPETQVRLFDSVLRLLLGRESRSDFVGLSPSVVAVVETDGAMEQDDVLKAAYSGAADTGYSVLRDDFDAMLSHPGVVSRQIGVDALSEACRECHLVKICGGGHYAHRYRPESGFVNQSAYCADLKKFILHVRDRLKTDLADRG